MVRATLPPEVLELDVGFLPSAAGEQVDNGDKVSSLTNLSCLLHFYSTGRTDVRPCTAILNQLLTAMFA